MSYLFDLIRKTEYPFREEKTGSKFTIITRRPHRDRDRAMGTVRQSETDLERFFDCKDVGRIFSQRSCDDTSNGYLRKCWCGFHNWSLSERGYLPQRRREGDFCFSSLRLAVYAVKLFCRHDPSSTLTQADASEPFAFTEAFHDDLVAVFEKASLFNGRQF